MKKIFVFGLIASLVPCLGFAENPQITRLMREKQNKIEQLEKCMGSTKGLKIAGISTLGLTAVGVAGNIAEASAIKKYDSEIEATDKKIEKTQQEIDEKRKKIEEAEIAEAQARNQERMLKNVVLADISAINRSGAIGDKAISRGYMPEQLPEGLRSQFANAMVNFIARCRANIGTNGIKEVSLSPAIQENWRQYVGSAPLSEELVLNNLNEHVIAECKVTLCDSATYNPLTTGGDLVCIAKNTSINTINGNKPAAGTDCTATFAAKNMDVLNAVISDKGVCEIQKCTGLNKVPSFDKQSCVDTWSAERYIKTPTPTTKTPCEEAVARGEAHMQYVSNPPVCVCNDNTKEWNGKNCVAKKASAGTSTTKKASEWTDAEKKAKPDEYCNLAYTSAAAKACCLSIHKYKQADSWDGAGMKCNCKSGLEWKNNTCALKATVPVLANDATYVAPTTIIEPMKFNQALPQPTGKTEQQTTCEGAGGRYLRLNNSGEIQCYISGANIAKCNTLKGNWYPVNSQYCKYNGG